MSHYEPLEDPEAAYQMVQELGVGSYGRVYQALELKTGRMVALKMMSQELDDNGLAVDAVDADSMESEVTLMKSLSHNEFIVSYYVSTLR